MDEATIDREAMGRLAKALAFICGADHATTVALKTAADSGSERDIKNARTLFLRLKQTERRAALAMLAD
jgi:biotin synthase-like enzyme